MAIHNRKKIDSSQATSSNNDENNSAEPREEIAMNQSQPEEQPVFKKRVTFRRTD